MMRNIQIRCEKEKRLFDAVDGSNLRIQLKCSNAKVCAHKSDCMRTTEVYFGGTKAALTGNYFPVHCPRCGKRLFNVTSDSVGIVNIKCDLCGNIAIVPFFANRE